MTRRKDLPAPMPWSPVTLTKDDARALHALGQGVASDYQQKKALSIIVDRICGYDDMEFRPDDMGGERASTFASGKRFAGKQIQKWIFATGSMIERCPDSYD